jgi:hypothetical protein
VLEFTSHPARDFQPKAHGIGMPANNFCQLLDCLVAELNLCHGA